MNTSPPPPIEPWAKRRIYAATLNRGMAAQEPTMEVETDGDQDDVLVITSTLCGAFLPGLLAKEGTRDTLSERGFKRLECRGGSWPEAVDLAP